MIVVPAENSEGGTDSAGKQGMDVSPKHTCTSSLESNEKEQDGGEKRQREADSINDGQEEGVSDAEEFPQHPRRIQSGDDCTTTDPVKVPAKKAKRCPLHVEAVIQPTCPSALEHLDQHIERFILAIGQSTLMYRNGPVDLRNAPQIIQESCVEISIVDIVGEDDDDQLESTSRISVGAPTVGSWNITEIRVHSFVLCDDEAEMEELENADDEDLTACETLTLPNQSLHGLWESLILPHDKKQNLLAYARSALLFSDRNVSSNIIDWNRVVLLHGPPGTGKTSLCRALAQKLAVRMKDRFAAGGHLVEIHSHSLFSKWFSESGKLVSRLFNRIREMVEDDPDALCCVLVDEVESLAAARAGGGGDGGGAAGEPSDAIRAVNSLLTSIDRLRRYKNVIVMTTTNLTGSVDVAFVDRADIKMFIGLPVLEGRYEILKSCVDELVRVGIIIDEANEASNMATEGDKTPRPITLGDKLGTVPKSTLPSFRDLQVTPKQLSALSTPSALLLRCSEIADGLSGRSLRKAPFQSHAMFIHSEDSVSLMNFLGALKKGIEKEQMARNILDSEKNTK